MQLTTQNRPLREKARIFIVEDETIVALDIQDKLEKVGHDVVGLASSGNDAIQKIKETQPDLIIMDVGINGNLNGIETAIVLLGAFDAPPAIVFLTGYSASSFSYLNVLADYIYLSKPFDESDLVNAVKLALERKTSS